MWTVRTRPASEIEPEPVDWLWQNRIPLGNTSAIVGEGGQAKSTLACELAARISRGQLPGDLHGTPADVIIATAEDSWSNTIVPRLIAAGADLDRVHQVIIETEDDDGPQEVGLTIPDDVTRIGDAVEMTGAVLVVLDPLVAFLSNRIDSHRDQSVRRALYPLKAIAEAGPVAVVAIIHTNKRTSANVLARVTGSGAFGNAVRSVLLLAQDPDSESTDVKVLVHGKSNLSPLAVTRKLRLEQRHLDDHPEIVTSAIVWLGDAPEISAADALQPGEDRTAIDDACELLTTLLATGPVPEPEIRTRAKHEAVSWTTVKRAKKKLRIVSTKTAFEGGWVWRLPGEEAPKGTRDTTWSPSTDTRPTKGTKSVEESQ